MKVKVELIIDVPHWETKDDIEEFVIADIISDGIFEPEIVAITEDKKHMTFREAMKGESKDDLLIKKGDKVRIVDAMDSKYIGKIGIVEEVSSHSPLCCKLTIDGKKGSWANAWLFSCLELIKDR